MAQLDIDTNSRVYMKPAPLDIVGTYPKGYVFDVETTTGKLALPGDIATQVSFGMTEEDVTVGATETKEVVCVRQTMWVSIPSITQAALTKPVYMVAAGTWSLTPGSNKTKPIGHVIGVDVVGEKSYVQMGGMEVSI